MVLIGTDDADSHGETSVSVSECVNFIGKDDSLIIISRQSDFVYLFSKYLVFTSSEGHHLSVLFFTAEKTPLIILKGDGLIYYDFLTPLHFFSSFLLSNILYEYSFALSPTNSSMI